ncbi:MULTISPECIES: Uma2 family endonuclease [unclassified Streptomyces]|uniref:Uma2 family endonuclease n=1 Tax=unclassified Streptomyces TaxID=2593676 RepID=UPI003421D964
MEPEDIEPAYRWPIPPTVGWTADDLDLLPDLPPHTELIDGSLVFRSPQTLFHMRTVSFITYRLEALIPPGLEVIREFTIDIDRHNRPEPDVIVVDEAALQSMEQTRLPAESVQLAVEVVSPDSVPRDRHSKPLKYACAKIPHFWRVENNDGRAVVYIYELDPATKAYVATGIFRDRLKVSVPYDIDLDLTAGR